MTNEQAAPTANAAAPQTQPAASAASAALPFPPVVIEGDVAIITIRSANGYESLLKVLAGDQLAFVRNCWPFELTGSRGKKRISRNGVDLATAAMQIEHGMDIRVHAPNGWLDWTTLTFTSVTKDDEHARQRVFEAETAFNRSIVPEESDELLRAHNTEPQKPEPETDRPMGAFFTAYDAAVCFAEVAVPPARPCRPHGLGADEEPYTDTD